MRVNIYAEEQTGDVEIIEKTINGQVFTGVRFYLKSPEELHKNENDDDRSAVTFWGKKDLHKVLYTALTLLGNHYSDKKFKDPLSFKDWGGVVGGRDE